MRVIISNDKKRLFGKIDYSLLQTSKLNNAPSAGDGAISLLNPEGFVIDDYIVIEDPEKEIAEIRQITSVSGNNVGITPNLSFAHEKKVNVYNIGYNQIRFYENDVLIDTATIIPDFYVESSYDVVTTNYYHITYYNSTTAAESPAGEKIYGYLFQLCSVSDVFKWENPNGIDKRIIDKIDIASQEIYARLTSQQQDVSQMQNIDVFRIPCALLALYYYWFGLIKTADDHPSLKSNKYKEMYDKKIVEAGEIINNTENSVKFYGQTRALR